MTDTIFRSKYNILEQQKADTLAQDLKTWVVKGMTGRLDTGMYGLIDAVANTPQPRLLDPNNTNPKPEELLAAKVYQAWTGYPQVANTLRTRGISKEQVFQEIGRLRTQIIEESQRK